VHSVSDGLLIRALLISAALRWAANLHPVEVV